MSQFTFLQLEWPAIDAARSAEAGVQTDPRTACFYTRRALELAVGWTYKYDAALVAVSGKPICADPRAEFKANGGRGGIHQGARHQHARQPRGPGPRAIPDATRSPPSVSCSTSATGSRAPMAARRGRRRAGFQCRPRSPRTTRAKADGRAAAATRTNCASATRSSSVLLADKTALDEE